MPETDSPLLQSLREAFVGRQLFLGGGALRDEVMGREGGDRDLATDARPDEISSRIGDWADAVWLAGERFGTVAMQWREEKAEITTFRSDSYDGVSRKPEVAFGDDLLTDLARRDFTINALARNLHTGERLDPFGGQEDIAERLVRFVGEPARRITEDPLRMLRAVRFCAVLGFELDPLAAVGIAEHARELRRISIERVRDELDRLLLSDRPKEGVQLLLHLGLGEQILPELTRLHLPEPGRHLMKDVLEHSLDTMRLVPAEKALRYAALLHDLCKPETFTNDENGVHFYRHDELGAARARDLLVRLRQPLDFADAVAALVRDHLRVPYYTPEWTDSAVRRLMFDLGDHLDANLTLADADVRASDPHDYAEFRARFDHLRRRLHDLAESEQVVGMRSLLNGDEVMALLGIAPGPQVGVVLRYLLDQQLEGTITTREAAEAAVQSEFGRAVE